jgi:hypothetical protein
MIPKNLEQDNKELHDVHKDERLMTLFVQAPALMMMTRLLGHFSKKLKKVQWSKTIVGWMQWILRMVDDAL